MEKEVKNENQNNKTVKKLSIPSTVYLTVIITLIIMIVVGIGLILFS